jgi:hypothetical protein
MKRAGPNSPIRQQNWAFTACCHFRLFVHSQNLGSVNLYSGQGRFLGGLNEAGSIVTQHAAVVMFGAAAEQDFHVVLASRDVIGERALSSRLTVVLVKLVQTRNRDVITRPPTRCPNGTH